MRIGLLGAVADHKPSSFGLSRWPGRPFEGTVCACGSLTNVVGRFGLAAARYCLSEFRYALRVFGCSGGDNSTIDRVNVVGPVVHHGTTRDRKPSFPAADRGDGGITDNPKRREMRADCVGDIAR